MYEKFIFCSCKSNYECNAAWVWPNKIRYNVRYNMKIFRKCTWLDITRALCHRQNTNFPLAIKSILANHLLASFTIHLDDMLY